MKFTKYHSHGAYHWRLYEKSGVSRRHAHRIKEWVQEKDVLDVGAGDGLLTHLLGIKGVDNEAEAVKLAKEKGADVVLADGYDLSLFPDNEFDAVLMADTLEHIEYPELVLHQVRRILSTFLYIVTPCRDTVNGKKDKFHYQEWTGDELKNLVESSGFSLEGEILHVKEDNCLYAKFKKNE